MSVKKYERSLGMIRLRYVRRPAACASSEVTIPPRRGRCGFTLIEIMIVAAIIMIAAAMAVPLVSSAAGLQIRSAANMLAADLEYAKSMAISRGQSFSVVFDIASERYSIQDQNGSTIAHPVKKGFGYVIDFANDKRLNKVDITTVDFNATAAVKFDYLGSPYDADTNPLNTGVVTLQAAGTTFTVEVEPVTGFISVND